MKAGSHFNARLTVPEEIRVTGNSPTRPNTGKKDDAPRSVTWIIEITSQIIFSGSAKVHFELLVSRDEKSLDYAFHAVPGHAHGEPGKMEDHQDGRKKVQGAHPASPKGVYSKAIKLVVADTNNLWDKPPLPTWDEPKDQSHRKSFSRRESLNIQRTRSRNQKKKKIHLVILTHGLHSNLSADMLYMKESIDATAKKAREAARERRQKRKEGIASGEKSREAGTAATTGGQEDLHDTHVDDDEDDEEIIVRGFGGNACKTESGIQSLGKKMARYILELTYPDQPFLPLKKSMSKKIADSLTPGKELKDGVDMNAEPPAHAHSSVHKAAKNAEDLAYTFTSISFIGHSLGGLIQLYAIAYIQKHAPHFFDQIEPINFVCMASPLLGLSNENPMYVRFALDFGLVGKTGQDLGLTWKPTTATRSGWSAVVNGLSGSDKEPVEDPKAKPLLRILPTGPAHRVLRRFRNRTLYSNVVNDGIVPLRTSCLLFLDWQGLEKVEKARRETGLIGTVVDWGWNEITGGPGSPGRSKEDLDLAYGKSNDAPLTLRQTREAQGHQSFDVPQPDEDATNARDDNITAKMPAHSQFPHVPHRKPENKSIIDEIWGWIRPSGKTTKTDLKMFKRSQTLSVMSDENVSSAGQSSVTSPISSSPPRNQDQIAGRPRATRGDSIVDNPNAENAPPKTTIFESAGDILNPPIPPQSWIIDPASRDRTIFHDRVYHPEDIPAPPPRKKSTLGSRLGGSGTSNEQARPPLHSTQSSDDTSGMRVEEKIARAYHKDLSWRKVLVRLEPDAHNNMIVRRMFANAYGWPVVKHLCDTHFGDTYSAQTRDEDEPAIDRAKEAEQPVDANGEKVRGQENRTPPKADEAYMRERPDELAPLQSEIQDSRRPSLNAGGSSSQDATATGNIRRNFSSTSTRAMTIRSDSDWDEQYFRDSEDDEDNGGPLQRILNPKQRESAIAHQNDKHGGTSAAEIDNFLHHKPPAAVARPMEGHRGLAPVPIGNAGVTAQRRPLSGGTEEVANRAVAEPVSPTMSTGQALGLRRNPDGGEVAPHSPLVKQVFPDDEVVEEPQPMID